MFKAETRSSPPVVPVRNSNANSVTLHIELIVFLTNSTSDFLSDLSAILLLLASLVYLFDALKSMRDFLAADESDSIKCVVVLFLYVLLFQIC